MLRLIPSKLVRLYLPLYSLNPVLAVLTFLSVVLGLQKATAEPGQSAFQRIAGIAKEMWRQEGVQSFYKGITPRVLRVAPGQAIVFAVYERVRKVIDNWQGSGEEDVYTE